MAFPLTIDELFKEMPADVRSAVQSANYSGIVSFAYKLMQDGDAVKTQFHLGDYEFNQLKQRLETLGLLGGAIPIADQQNLPGWLVSLVRDCPTKATLQARRYKELDAWLVGRTANDRNTDTIRNAVVALWCQGRNLREELSGHAIPLEVADILEHDEAFRINGLAGLQQDHIDQFTRGRTGLPKVSPAHLKQLMVLYRKHSTEHSREQTAVKEKLDSLQKATDDAKERVKVLLKDAESEAKTPDQVREGLKAVSTSLAGTAVSSAGAGAENLAFVAASTTWATGIKDRVTAIKALENALTELAGTKTQIQAGLGHAGQDVSDEDIIAGVGSGAALYGVAFGMPLECTASRAPRPVLARPDLCRLMPPEAPFTVYTQELNSEESATTFQSVLQASGHSLSASLKASGWGFDLSTGASTSASREQQRQKATATRRTSASVVQMLFVPVRTFRIPETQMALNGEALARARAIRDRRQADDFLHDFYSHVPSTVITVGGTFSRVVTVTVTEASSAQALSNKAKESLSGNIGAGGSGYGFSAQVAVSASSFNDLDEQGRATNDRRDCSVRTFITAYGPPVTSADVFVAQLLSNRDTWRIIDRGDHRTLVPVWDLMLRHPEVVVQRAGRLVRQAWLHMAHELLDISVIRTAYERTLADARLEDLFVRPDPQNGAVQALPEPPSHNRNADLAPLETFVNRSVATILQSSDGTPDWERHAAQALVRVFMAIRQWSSKMNNGDLLCRFLVLGEPLANALITCAQRCVASNEARPHPFPAVRDALFACISPPQQTELQQHNVSAPLFNNSDIQKLFRTRNHSAAASDSGANAVWDALAAPNHGSLPVELRRLLDTTESVDSKSAQVQRMLVWNLYQGRFASTNEANRLRLSLRREFGLLPDGFFEPLSKEQLELLYTRVNSQFADLHVMDDRRPSRRNGYDRGHEAWLRQLEVSPFAERFLVDRPLVSRLARPPARSSIAEEDWELVDALVHRLALPGPLVAPQVGGAARDDAIQAVSLDDMFAHEPTNGSNSNSASTQSEGPSVTLPYERMARMLSEGDEVIQNYLISALLQRRCAVPLAASRWAFENVETRLLAGVTSNIIHDQELIRVALVSLQDVASTSRQTPALVKDVLGCDTLTAFGVSGPTAEIGYGWLPSTTAGGSPTPLILVHIIGAAKYDELKTRLHELCDVVLFESNQGSNAFRPQSSTPWPARFIFLTPEMEFSHTVFPPAKDNPIKFNSLKGMATQDGFKSVFKDLLRETLRDRDLLSTVKELDHPVCLRDPLWLLLQNDQPTAAAASLDCPISQESYIKGVLERTDFGALRDQNLPLQKYFRDQVTAIRASKNPDRSPAEQTEALYRANECMRKRFDVVNSLQLEHLPILTLFEALLRLPRSSDRVRSYLMLDRLLGEYCEKKLEDRLQLRQQARGRYEDRVSRRISAEEQHQLELQRMHAELAVANAIVAPEHLFRELACMYEAMHLQAELRLAPDARLPNQANRYADLPMLAALHLLDGFPLELIDGDCSWASPTWLQAVMNSLQMAINFRYPKPDRKESRVFVISILGVQKAGKSSLLNVLFGCRFRTSIERCTRGLNMQLLRCEREDGLFDFLLVLDTEGVRAPDLRHTENAVVHDNRLAVYAVWLAHATLVLIAGNQSNEARDILSVVKYISDRSTGALGRLRNRLFFAMRSVSTAQGPSVVAEVRTVLFNLITSALQTAASNADQNPNDFLTDFQVDEDIFAMGNISMSDHPPGDVPDVQYGLSASALRERIHSRCCGSRTNFKPYTISEWTDHFLKAQEEILAVESVMKYRSADARIAQELLDQEVSRLRQDVSQSYVTAFQRIQDTFVTLVEGDTSAPTAQRGLFAEARDKVTEDIRAVPELEPQRADLERKQLIRLLNDIIERSAHTAVVLAAQQLETIVTRPSNVEFRDVERVKWNAYVSQQQQTSAERVQNLVLARKFFNTKENEYKQQIVAGIHKLSSTYPLEERQFWTEERKSREFEEIFDQVRRRATQECPPLHLSVESKITKVYKRKNIATWNIPRDALQPSDRNVNVGSRDNAADEPWYVRYTPRWIRKYFHGDAKRIQLEEQRLNRLIIAVTTEVQRVLRDHMVYSDAAVELVIRRTEEFVRSEGEERLGIITQIHAIVRHELAKVLYDRQKEWDRQYSVPEKISASRNTLHQFFLGVINGQVVLERLRNYLIEMFRSVIKAAHKYEVVRVVAQVIREQENDRQPGFVTSSRILQNLADLDLLDIMDNDDALQKALLYPQGHYDKVTKQRISAFVKREFENNSIWLRLREVIVQGLLEAAQEAGELPALEESGVAPGRSQRFFTVLRARLQRNDDLLLALPLPEDSANMFNIDTSNAAELRAVAGAVGETLPAPTLDAAPIVPDIPTLPRQRQNDAKAQHQLIVDDILSYLRVGRLDDRFRLRCPEVCPVCGIRCNHPDGSGHTGLHRSPHQPSGLNGIRQSETLVLWPLSCIECAIRDLKLKFPEGAVPFRNLQSKYPNWENPPWTEDRPGPLKVREHIFYHKQDLLHDMHPDTIVCPNSSRIINDYSCISMPAEYAWDKSSLRQALEADLQDDR